ncbi:hypothetical protein HYFRA_00004725 [Hymenoscyphus fraxineus]|uniref:Aminotransferase class I/classII large domain-containing protein n=1 Tax=Hymenoscyphus fraxineus TaxID=746836 RepID=A0A9N9PT41_9HELO|nr:hypothetical protein HYFRA_00004725 [Hymenoscyphus fraxineus]
MGGEKVPMKEINLLRGWPHPSLLPVDAISRASVRATGDTEVVIPGLCYGPDAGFGPLRGEVGRWLGEFYDGDERGQGDMNGNGGVEGGEGEGDRSERICITGGASQNLACVLQVFSDPGVTRVWMVVPTYFLAMRIFEDSGLVPSAVPEGKEGVDLGYFERELERDLARETTPIKVSRPYSKAYRHILYCVPTFSNPSGKTMTLSCRKSLIHLARKYDVLILSDDVYDSLQWPISTSPAVSSPTKPHALLPRLVDLDATLSPVPSSTEFGNTVSSGTFSKIAGPGVRTGWAEASPRFIHGLSQCGSSRSGGAPSQFTATIIFELLRSGDLDGHINDVLIPTYQRRYTILREAIERVLVPKGVVVGETSVRSTTEMTGKGEGVFGGYFLWITLPSGMNAEYVALRAKEEEELILAPGRIFEVDGKWEEGAREVMEFGRSMRLCFSWVDERDLKEGVERLGRVVERVGVEGVRGQKGGRVDLANFR